MTGSLDALIAATAVFVFGHFLLSSGPLRTPLVRTLGQGGFLPLYSIAVAAAFLWMLAAYRKAPAVQVWTPDPVLNWVPILVMPVAIFLVLAGITTSNPTMVGGEQRIAASGPARRAPGIISVTRYPFLWGTTLWAASHLAANGTAAEMIVMGGILVLGLGGMAHIDQRREVALGSALGPDQDDHQRGALRGDPERPLQARLGRHRLVAPGRRAGPLRRDHERPRLDHRRAGDAGVRRTFTRPFGG